MTIARPEVGTGRNRIEAIMGRGGMGVVFLATHSGLDRKVAPKLLTPESSALIRFFAENARFIAP